MPSPFPGMDPYLENPADWPGFHHLLVSAAVELLQPQFRPRGHYVNVDERIWLEEPGRAVYPEASIIEHPRPQSSQPTSAAAIADEPVRIKTVAMEIREPFVEIFDAKGNRLITAIELLSPANKSPGKGAELYEQKRVELLAGGANLVEIDLLRAGQHIVDVPQPALEALGHWDYLINLVRAGRREYEVYPITVRQRLPRIRIPLKTGEPDAALDLQAAASMAYDRGPYPERLRYDSPAIPPLEPDDATWAKNLLQAAGLRGAS